MRILLAEDHPLLAQSLAKGLREEGYAVDHADDGTEALHLAQANHYDGIVLDILLPGTDGWAILKALRSRNISTPVLCLTALGTVRDRVRGFELGSDDYLVKPFAWEELLARVKALIRRGPSRPATITIADLEVDTARREVFRAGARVDLSAREYALLEYLAHRRDQVVSRAEIRDHLYDRNDRSTSNVIDVYIRYLRGKIDDEHNQKLIHTLRGHGYMLSTEP